MTKKHDWTKLDDGWVREPTCIRIDNAYGTVVRVHDDGYLQVYGLESPERTLELLIEAVAQRKQCEVREPRFKFGDWVRVNDGDTVNRIVSDAIPFAFGIYYVAVYFGTDEAFEINETELTPCDPPGDEGEE